MKPIAVRLKNPLNLRPLPSGQKWNGQIGVVNTTNGLFCKFKDWPHGLRAPMVNLRTYQQRYGIRALVGPNGYDGTDGFITRWAPSPILAPQDNNHTKAYVHRVARLTGIHPEETIDITDPAILRLVIPAMHRVEAGISDTAPMPWTDAEFDKALRLAGYEFTDVQTPAPPAPEPEESGGLIAWIIGLIRALFGGSK